MQHFPVPVDETPRGVGPVICFSPKLPRRFFHKRIRESLANMVNERTTSEFYSPVFTQKKTMKANELVHLCIYQESKLLTFLSSPMQLGCKQVSNFYIIHDSTKKETLTKG